jgi:hypothetical protein
MVGDCVCHVVLTPLLTQVSACKIRRVKTLIQCFKVEAYKCTNRTKKAKKPFIG